MTFFQYGFRRLQFDDFIRIVQDAITSYPFTTLDSDSTKKDKLDLMEMVKYALEQFSLDRNLNQIFPGNGEAESNLEFTKKAVINQLTHLTRKSLEKDDDDDDETVSEDFTDDLETEAAMVVQLYIDGFGQIQHLDPFQRKHAYFMMEMYKLMKEMRPDVRDVEPITQGFTQLESVQVWQKLYIKLQQKFTKKTSNLSNNYVHCCICFCRMAFGSLSALSSTFHLERTGFIAY